jgi:hypothetical protein
MIKILYRENLVKVVEIVSLTNVKSFYIEDASIMMNDVRYDFQLKLNMKKEFISLLVIDEIPREYIKGIKNNIKY